MTQLEENDAQELLDVAAGKTKRHGQHSDLAMSGGSGFQLIKQYAQAPAPLAAALRDVPVRELYTPEEKKKLQAIHTRYVAFTRQIEGYAPDVAGKLVAARREQYQAEPTDTNLAALQAAITGREALQASNSQLRSQVYGARAKLATEAMPILEEIQQRIITKISVALAEVQKAEATFTRSFGLEPDGTHGQVYGAVFNLLRSLKQNPVFAGFWPSHPIATYLLS